MTEQATLDSALTPVGSVQMHLQLRLDRRGGAPFEMEVESTLPGTGISAVFGPSGCGKTTLLRCLAGLQQPDHGRLIVNGETWHDERRFLPTHQRPLGYVFQEASLFPHLSVNGNLDYARRRSGVGQAQDFDHIVALMGLEALLPQRPDQLSGGERQRVAIARALLIRPRLLLMDEPLAALDRARKQDILPYLEALHREVALPVIYVTHSMDEVTRLADHLLLMEQGRVLAQGPLQDLLSRPDLPVELGQDTGAVIEGRIVERNKEWHLARLDFAGGELWLRDSGEPEGETLRLRILARDVSLSLSPDAHSSILNRLPATVSAIESDQDAAMALVQLRCGETALLARVSRKSVSDLALQPGMNVWAQIKSVAILR